MARSRLLKPGFFANELLAELPFEARLCFAGLWTLADREGRLEDRPKRIGAALFPYDTVDIVAVLGALEAKGFIERYSVDGVSVISLPTFLEHQKPHLRENASVLPSPDKAQPRHDPVPNQTQPRRPCTVSVSVPISIKREERASLSPDPFIDTKTTDRAGAFLERYQELYPKHRNGARYAMKPARDYAAAVTLCATWTEDRRLDRLAVIFLTTDHKFAEEGSRTVPQFLALASWCDGKLAAHEAAKQGAA